MMDSVRPEVTLFENVDYCFGNGGGTGTAKLFSDERIVFQHPAAIFLVLNQFADLRHECIRIAVILNQFLERQFVNAEIAEAYVLDFHDSFGNAVGQAPHSVADNLRSPDEDSLQ